MNWWLVVLVAFGVALCAIATAMLISERRRVRLVARRRAARAAAREQERLDDKDRPSPHPGRSCNAECDITDEAHGYGGVFIAHGDEPLMTDDEFLDHAEAGFPHEPVPCAVEAVRPVSPARGMSVYGCEACQDFGCSHCLKEDWRLLPTAPEPLRGKPEIPGATVLLPGFAGNEIRDMEAQGGQTIVARVVTEEEREALAATLLEPTGSWIVPADMTPAEFRYEQAFYNDPLGSAPWIDPPADALAEQESRIFWELAEQWMDGVVEKGEFDEWASSSLVPELVGSTT